MATVKLLLFLILVVLVAAFFPTFESKTADTFVTLTAWLISLAVIALAVLALFTSFQAVIFSIIYVVMHVPRWLWVAFKGWLLIVIGPVIAPYRSWVAILDRERSGERIGKLSMVFEVGMSLVLALFVWATLVLMPAIILARVL